jgi:hypothetical protein
VDPNVVAKKDGKAFRTNKVKVEDGYTVHAEYELKLCEEEEIGRTGRLKILELFPSDPKSTAARFIGRWDEKENFLDIDPIDAKGNVDRSVKFKEHHPKALPDRHFGVKICTSGKLLFKGVVSFGLGRDIQLGDLATFPDLKAEADVVHGKEHANRRHVTWARLAGRVYDLFQGVLRREK